MQKTPVTPLGMVTAFLAVIVLGSVIGWLFYCVHYASADSWQKRIFSGENGLYAVLWFAVVAALPAAIAKSLRLKTTTHKNDFPIAVVSTVSSLSIIVAVTGSMFFVTAEPVKQVLAGIVIGGLVLYAASEFMLKRRSNKTLQPTPKDGAAER